MTRVHIVCIYDGALAFMQQALNADTIFCYFLRQHILQSIQTQIRLLSSSKRSSLIRVHIACFHVEIQSEVHLHLLSFLRQPMLQTLCTPIRLLPWEQSDQGLYCLLPCLKWTGIYAAGVKDRHTFLLFSQAAYISNTMHPDQTVPMGAV